MKFFVPLAASPEEAESIYSAFATNYQADDLHERIYKLVFRHDGQVITAEVGQPIDRRYDGGIVLAILYAQARNLWFVITTNRGLRNDPIFAGHDIVSRVPFDKAT